MCFKKWFPYNLSACLSKKGETESENFSGPKSRKSQNHSQASFSSVFDPKSWVCGHTGQQNGLFWPRGQNKVIFKGKRFFPFSSLPGAWIDFFCKNQHCTLCQTWFLAEFFFEFRSFLQVKREKILKYGFYGIGQNGLCPQVPIQFFGIFQ